MPTLIDKSEEHFSASQSEYELSVALNKRLFFVAFYGFVCNLIAWFVWLKPIYADDVVGSFIWFTVLPMCAQLLAMLICVFVNFISQKLNNSVLYAVLGSFCYAFFFVSMIYFYRNNQIFWLFAIGPLLLASFYRRYVWMNFSLLWTMAGVIAVIFGAFEDYGYELANPPKAMVATETLIVGSLMAFFAIGIHAKVEAMIKNVAHIEATKQAKDVFFAKMSHEIRTPINAVLGMNELILKEEISPEVENYSVNIKRAGQNLLAIINDILDSSKLESGGITIATDEYDLMNVLLDSYNLIRSRADEKGLEIRVVNDPSVPKNLIGDEVRVKQILTNLLTNAVKYTQSGYVELNVAWRKKEEDDMDLILTVKDTGIGIKAEEKEKLFDTFERLDEKRNKYIEGTGLGLSITKQFVELMQGKIEVESVLDEGSSFKVTIPQTIAGSGSIGDFYKNLEKAFHKDSQEHEKFTSYGTKILVVDDVQMNLDVFKGLLKKSGTDIDAALSGEAAIRLANKKKYDMIFMDHLMPGMDGVEAMKTIRSSSKENADTPVIALTANVSKDSEAEYKELGFDAFLAKPVKGKNIEEMITYILNSREEAAIS